MKEIRRCTRCIMDDASDSTIRFDEKGYCNYCTRALGQINKTYFPNAEGQALLVALLAKIKAEGKGKKYDCVMGLSGGLDSSYLAYLGYKWGLRVLAVHIDDGFDTDISKANLQKLVAATGFDYEVITPDAAQFDALTKAYMKAGVANLAAPQDNVLFAFLYDRIKAYGIRYFLSGGNFALECILQRDNTHSAFDLVNLLDINRQYGTLPTDKLHLISTLGVRWDDIRRKTQSPRPLNYIDYDRARAFAELEAFCGFQYYGRKHLENILTAFVQLYWFPKKFGVDKRTSHLSSMIVSGQMSREEALREYAEPLYDEAMMASYIATIKEKLGISDAEFDQIMAAPARKHEDFKTEGAMAYYKLFSLLLSLHYGAMNRIRRLGKACRCRIMGA